MFKILFILVINAYHGGMATIEFTTLQQCEAAKEIIAKETKKGSNLGMVCIEKQIPIKKTKCKIINDFSYKNENTHNSNAENLTGYPYPVSIECEER